MLPPYEQQICLTTDILPWYRVKTHAGHLLTAFVYPPQHTHFLTDVELRTPGWADLYRQDLKKPAVGRWSVTYFLLIITHPQEVQSMPEEIMPKVKMCVFLQGREISHRKCYKGGLNFSAVQTLLRPHALYSSNAVKPTSSHSRQNQGSLFQAGGQAQDQSCGAEEVLRPLLLLKSTLSGSGQHPPTQGHRVRGRAF